MQSPNKASQSELHTLSSFFQKTAKKSANMLRQLLATLYGFHKRSSNCSI
jgi:hypothetical protein